MSTSKRISVFDRLGPGTDEPAPSHRRHTSSSSGAQEKGRGHTYVEVRETPLTRDRKGRHRASMGDYPSSAVTDVKGMEEKRTPNPPPLSSTRDAPEALKSVGVKQSKASGSGESDYESGEDGKRRKGYHGDQDMPRSDGPEEGSGRRGKDKGHSHLERPSSSTGHHRSPVPSDKQRPRRDGGGGSIGHEHKRRKEDESKPTSSELGHKRKRDYYDEGHMHETKRTRHGDSSRDRESDHHHGDHYHSSKDSEHAYGSTEKKWRSELIGSELMSRKQLPVYHSSGGDRDRGRDRERERGRERDRSSSRTHRHSSREGRKTTLAQEKEHVRANEGRSSRSLDWSIVSSYTERANSKLKYTYPVAVLKKFTPGAVFSNIAVSQSLAGPMRYEAILDLVRAHVKENGKDGVPGCWLEAIQPSVDPISPNTSHKTRMEWDKTISDNLGPCRRALTAADDYVLRRMLRKGQDGSFIASPANSWATSQYQIALDFYNTLPTKPSGKPTNRLQTSRVGTLVL